MRWLRPRRRFRFVPYGEVLICDAQSAAGAHARTGGIALVMAGEVPKIAVLLCPSGCGEVLRVNLMREMGKAWRARLDEHGRLTLTPSVHLEGGCRAHFILRANTAIV